MKKVFLVLSLLLFVNLISFAQEAGNRIYGNQGYYNQQKRLPQTNTGSLASGTYKYSTEASVLLNVKADAFVAVFGVSEEGTTSQISNEKVNAKFADFAKALKSLGVSKDDIFIDFITQNRVYDYKQVGNDVIETLTGFETKKTIAIRYKNRELFETLVTTAANNSIFDLIKVDYIVSDFESVRAKLFEEAVKIIKLKEQKYTSLLGVTLSPSGVANEKYDAFYPNERYEKYQAYESGGTSRGYQEKGNTITARKSLTFFYEPLNETNFDRVLNPVGIEPIVQFTLYLRMDYFSKLPKEQ